MSKIVLGTLEYTEQPVSYGYQAGKGSYIKRTYKVPDETKLSGLISTLIADGYSYEVTEGPVITVEARFENNSATGGGDPTTTPLTDVWERVPVMVDKEILESNLSIVNQGLIGADTEGNGAKRLLLDAVEKREALSSPLSSDTAATTIYKLMMNGVKTVRVWQPTIRRTITAASTYAVAWSDANVGRILTSGNMVSWEGTPSVLLFNLPTETSTRGDLGLRVGFYKKPASVLQLGNGQWQIQQEYEFGWWASDIYDAGT